MARSKNTRNQMIQGSAAGVASLPAPVGGWNVRDSLANMAPTDAVILENMFPSVSNVVLRGGYSNWATGLPGQVETLMTYAGLSVQELYAASGSGIYDVTNTGAVGAAVVSGLTNIRWEHTNITTAGGSYLMAVNGVDTALLYDGAAWTNPTITGVSSAVLHNVTLFKNRLWFTETNTLKAYYLPTSSIGGAAEQFDLTSVAQLGGYLVSCATWTIDAGYGSDDNLAFVTSNGEVIVYRGTDPASASTWSLIGVWSLGAPIGNRCFLKYGGDLLLLTINGLFPLSQVLQTEQTAPQTALSDKIQGAIAAATSTYQNSFGWQIVFSAKNNAIWVNVPFGLGTQQQFVMNNITRAWCNFKGWPANCWEIFDDEPYFGGNTVVGKAWDDTVGDNGANIVSDTLQAFNYFDSRGVKKYFTRARPSIYTNGQPSVFLGINVDFELTTTASTVAFAPSNTGYWDTGVWDTSTWGSGPAMSSNWQGVTGLGYCGGLRFITESRAIQIEWAATDVVYQQGWAGI